MEYLVQHIESLIFTADTPISFDEISNCLTEAFGLKFPNEEIEGAIEKLQQRYAQDEFSMEVVEIADGYQFLTKGSFHQTVGVYLQQTMRRRLSSAALETLAIIAYKQPVSKGDMERIRGVSCDYSVQKLLEKELVSIVGRSEGPGRPLLYGTSQKFMDYFGLKNIDDLPKPKDFKDPGNQIGEMAPIEEEISEISIEEVEAIERAESAEDFED